MGFDKLGISPDILKAVHDAGFTEPTAIQEQAIPVMLQGLDVIAQAQTGTGKTAAFAVTILQTLKPAKNTEALVLVPTRELAMQVVEEFKLLGRHSPHSILAVYGGENIERQIRELQKGAQVVVGTPGRIIDHLERRTLNLSHAKIVVLDEADRMLDMGFIDDVKLILSHTAAHKQTLLFSATMPQQIIDLSRQSMVDPQVIKTSEDKLTVDNVLQLYVGVDGRDKISALTALLRLKKPSRTIIFTRTKYGADNLHYSLERQGFHSIALHGNLTQAKREKSLDDFRRREGTVLVATDIAARGLDIDDVALVVNYNIPEEPMTYVHRIGRTARAGKEGEAVSFATNLAEKRFLEDVAKMTGSAISEMKLEFKGRPASNEDTEYRGHGRNPFQHFEDDRRFGVAPAESRAGGFRGGRPERRGGFGGPRHDRGDKRGGGVHSGGRGGERRPQHGGGFHGRPREGGHHGGGRPPHHGGQGGQTRQQGSGRPPAHRRPPQHR
ncbi:MAG: DEAD/DEAH box helicase [Candidatus Micrarchaeota archaeon]